MDNDQAHRWLLHRLRQAPPARTLAVFGPAGAGKRTLVAAAWPSLPLLDLGEAPPGPLPDDGPPMLFANAHRAPERLRRHVGEPPDPRRVRAFTASTRTRAVSRLDVADPLELWPLMLGEVVAASTGGLTLPLLDSLLVDPRPLRWILGPAEHAGPPADLDLRTRALDGLLQWGGMPGLADAQGSRRAQLSQWRHTWVERDLPLSMRLPDPSPFLRFRQAAAQQATNIVSHAELARDADLSPSTARRYLAVLELAHQVFVLEPLKRELTSDPVRTPKLYWADPGWLRLELDHWGPATPQLFENTVVSEVLKWIRTMRRPVSPTFYRTRSGMEVDLLVRAPGGHVGLDVCPRQSVHPPDARALRAVAQALAQRWRGGVVVYRGRQVVRLDKALDLWAVPAAQLF